MTDYTVYTSRVVSHIHWLSVIV